MFLQVLFRESQFQDVAADRQTCYQVCPAIVRFENNIKQVWMISLGAKVMYQFEIEGNIQRIGIFEVMGFEHLN